MLKPFFGFVGLSCLIASCAAPPQSAGPVASAGSSAAVSSVDNQRPNQNDDSAYESVYVPPPVGSLLGGGYVRVPKKVTGTDEKALLGNINLLNAAAGSKDERPFVVAAVSRVTGVSPGQLQAQQDRLQLRFGELCAINTIARGDNSKVAEIAALRAKGHSWSQLAQSNGLSLAMVVEKTRNASDLTSTTYSNTADRRKGGQDKYRFMGVKELPRPGD
jgi:hypothetical protein